jgi:hypothetical protein
VTVRAAPWNVMRMMTLFQFDDLPQDPKEPALSAAKGLLCDQKRFPNVDFLQIPDIALQKDL